MKCSLAGDHLVVIVCKRDSDTHLGTERALLSTLYECTSLLLFRLPTITALKVDSTEGRMALTLLRDLAAPS